MSISFRPTVVLSSLFLVLGFCSSLPGQVGQNSRAENDEIESWLKTEVFAKVTRDQTSPARPITEIEFEPFPNGWTDGTNRGVVSGDTIKRVSELGQLDAISFAGTRFRNEDLVHLQELPALKVASFRGTRLNKTGIRHLGGIKSLESLDIGHLSSINSVAPDFDGESLTHLTQLPNLKRLVLDGAPQGGWQNETNWLNSVRIIIHTPQYKNDALWSCRGGLRDEHVQYLKGLKLESLSLTTTKLTNEGVRQLVEMVPDLKELNLDYVGVRDRGVAHLAKLEKLEKLSLRMTPITLKDASGFSELKQLRILNLYGAPIVDDGLKHLAELPNLQELHLDHSLINDKAIEHFKTMPSLSKVSLGGTRISLEALHDLAESRPEFRLKDLLIQRGVAGLNEREQIVSLDLAGFLLSSSDIKFLNGYPHLRKLDLRKNSIGNDGMRAISSLTNLEMLLLDGNPINDLGVAQLIPLGKLKRLTVKDTKVTLSGLRELFLDGQGRSPREVLKIAGFSLDSSGGWDVNLVRTNASDKDMEMVAGVDAVRSMKLVGNEIGTAGIKHLTNHPTLESLWIQESSLSANATTHLATIPNLKHLWCPNAPFQNTDLEPLWDLENLETLNLCGCPIDDGAVKYLADITDLKTLIVDSQSLSDDGIADLRASLPDVEVIRSQRNALAFVRNREREMFRIRQGSTRRKQHAGVSTTIREHPLVELFGDEFFEQAERISIEPKKLNYLGKNVSRLADLGTARNVSFINVPLPDGMFNVLNQLPELSQLSFYRVQLGSNRLDELQRLPEITELELGRSPVTSKHLDGLPDMPKLKVLRMGGHGTQIDSLAFLKKMPNLTRLSINRTNTDDEDLIHVLGLSSLQSLSARETGMTDEVFRGLADVKSLEQIDVSHTKVTDAGLDALKDLPLLKRVSAAGAEVSGQKKYRFEVRTR